MRPACQCLDHAALDLLGRWWTDCFGEALVLWLGVYEGFFSVDWFVFSVEQGCNQLIFFEGKNDCNLLLDLTTKHIFENLEGAVVRFPSWLRDGSGVKPQVCVFPALQKRESFENVAFPTICRASHGHQLARRWQQWVENVLHYCEGSDSRGQWQTVCNTVESARWMITPSGDEILPDCLPQTKFLATPLPSAAQKKTLSLKIVDICNWQIYA